VPQRVLIVDDDVAFRDVARTLLSDLGYLVAGATSSAVEARAAVESLRPDALLLDVNLPDGNGIALAAEVLASRPGTRILLTSSDGGSRPRDGMAPFVAKTQLARTDLTAYLGKP
jgi:two-component system, NarL family, response regulator DesR